MFGQSADASNYKCFQSWITEIMVNEVIKVISERTDSYDELESSKHQVKTSIHGDDKAADNLVLEGGITEKSQVADVTHSENMCYPSLIDYGVHINSSPVSKSSKQGEGDYQPTLRETTAFYQLRHEHNDLSNQDASTSSIITEQSDNELIESLQNNIDALSFDNVRLSESEFDSDAQSSPSHETEHNRNYFESSISLLDVDQSDKYDYDINQSNCTNEQLRHSQKFCQVNDTQYFPSDPNLPPDYFKTVDEHYEQYMLTADKDGEEQELLSGSSQELLIIESETINNDENSCNTNPFYCHHNKQESALDSSLNCPVISEAQKQNKTSGEFLNWEEEVEVQVNVTEPTQIVQTDFGVVNTDISSEVYTEENCMIKSRTYWSNIGLMTEQVARDYLGPTPDDSGFESMKSIKKVKSEYLGSKRYSERELLVVDPQDREEIIMDRAPNPGKFNNKSNNNLSFRKKSKESNQMKKKNIFFRISGLFSNMFRQKKKNKPARAQVPQRPKDASS